MSFDNIPMKRWDMPNGRSVVEFDLSNWLVPTKKDGLMCCCQTTDESKTRCLCHTVDDILNSVGPFSYEKTRREHSAQYVIERRGFIYRIVGRINVDVDLLNAERKYKKMPRECYHAVCLFSMFFIVSVVSVCGKKFASSETLFC